MLSIPITLALIFVFLYGNSQPLSTGENPDATYIVAFPVNIWSLKFCFRFSWFSSSGDGVVSGVVLFIFSSNLFMRPLFNFDNGIDPKFLVLLSPAVAEIEIMESRSGVILVWKLKSFTKLEAPLVGLYPYTSISASLLFFELDKLS